MNQELRRRLGVDGRKVLVLGLAVTGQATARVLADAGASVLASDLSSSVDSRAVADLEAAGIDVEVGSHDRAASSLGDVDFVLPSPGISPGTPILSEAIERGVTIASELDIAQEATDAIVVAVTGTNGKTTTCRLAGAIATESGLSAFVCGNTEVPFLASVAENPDADLFIVEASSFRLAFCESFHARVAVVTNFAPDHLDWHPTLGDYYAAKSRIASNQEPGDLFLFPSDQPELSLIGASAGSGGMALPFGHGDGDKAGAWVDGDDVSVIYDGVEIRASGASALTSRGLGFAQDAAAACGALVFCGAPADAIERALRGFTPDAHRLDPVGSLDGVRYYDDSKATNPHAALASLRSFDVPVVLIAGGRNKGLDLSALRSEPARLRAVVAMGEAADQVAGVFEGTSVPVSAVGSMDDAVRGAKEQARPGDVVLFAPACASFDAYEGYAARGLDFVRACRSLGVGM